MENLITDTVVDQFISGNEPYIREVLHDFWICCVSRQASIISRREVMTGKAKFGIGGCGKEVAQVAMARAFKKGDFRTGYYRDQTFMFAIGQADLEGYFAQIYADNELDPFSGGRQMASHFATRFIDDDGNFTDLREQYNVTADISSTAGQVGRGLGIALASKKFRDVPELADHPLNDKGKGISFFTIGDGSTSEGPFWEMMNAAAVMKVPIAVNVWDDGYAISVPKKYQTVKESISRAMEGFLIDENKNGIRIYTAKGWDYPGLVELYDRAIHKIREEHIPALIHVMDMTQPLGHSTSGSHERYKSGERLEWEHKHDCIMKFQEWIIENELATEEELSQLKKEAVKHVKNAKNKAWKKLTSMMKKEKEVFTEIVREIYRANNEPASIKEKYDKMNSLQYPRLSDIVATGRQISHELALKEADQSRLLKWLKSKMDVLDEQISTHLYSQTGRSPMKVAVVEPVYSDNSPMVNGYQILNQFFEKSFERYSDLFAFGEDIGKLGDVNQGFAGLQDKFGEHRIFDTGIREWTIIGQAIGMGMRGLKAIAEIQYLDYVIYALAPLSDDLATVRYRSDGIQMSAPIIRTRAHRLEGIWHSGSPMGMLLNSLKGMHLCVPRNMVQAAGMYNTLLQSDDPAMVIEVLNGYRIKERKPDNLGEYTVPLGQAECMREGNDLTVVSYGATLWIVMEAADYLEDYDISIEVIDVQTLMPFDIQGMIRTSVKKTNRILFVDEDVPGGGTAYMLERTLSEQNIFGFLEIPPRTFSSREHRPAYGDDGDYTTKPNTEDIVMEVLRMLHQVNPEKYPVVI